MAYPTNSSNQFGYTYFGLLFTVALISLALSGTAMVYKVEQQREKENELLFIGGQYVHAIRSYYESGNGGINAYPKSIDDLLLDPRSPIKKRHLRKPWKDPMTGKFDWFIIKNKDGQIIGLHSKSSGKTIKKRNFDEFELLLSDKTTYQDWRFIFKTPNSPRKLKKNNRENESENAGNN